MNKRRLGRGLDSLLGTEEGGSEAASLENAEMMRIPVEKIDPNPFQPRRVFDAGEIAALAESIREHGILQPILVRTVDQRYQLIAGERRLRGCIEAKLSEIPARIMVLDDRRVSELAMVENLQREDLNAIEKAMAFKDYLGRYHVTQEELAGRLGIDRSTVSNLIRLLELPESVRDAVMNRKISPGHARALLGLGDAEAITAGCLKVIAEGLSVRQVEGLVSSGSIGATTRVRKDSAEGTPTKAPHFVELEDHLKERFSTAVSVKPRGKGRGQIIIEYQSHDEFERVSGLIRGL